jgi:iron complex transport system substrate-binding protein
VSHTSATIPSIYRLDERMLRGLRPDLMVTQELCDVCAVAYSDVQRAVRRLSGDIPILSLEPRRDAPHHRDGRRPA